MAELNAAGTTGSHFDVRLEAGKIEEFARAVGSPHPAHRGTDSTAPATFLTIQNFYESWAEDEANPWRALAFEPSREMHAEQEFIFHGPPLRAGTVLRAQSRIESVTERTGSDSRALTFAVMITEYRNADGDLVAEAICTGVHTAPDDQEADLDKI